MRMHVLAVLAAALAIAAPAGGLAGEFPVQSKVLDTPADPTTQTVLVGRSPAGGMIIQFELEPAKTMWMQMGNPLTWMEHPVGDGERYHVEVKPIDPKSKTRISFASVTFKAVNKDSQASVEGTHNRILKASLRRLARAPKLNPELSRELRALAHRFPDMTDIWLERSAFSRVQLHRNNAYYDYLLRVAELAFDCLPPDPSGGGFVFQDVLRDERKMAIVFEEFVRNFYRVEQQRFAVKPLTIQWDATTLSSSEVGRLPNMIVDVFLQDQERKIIIDTKYYASALQSKRGSESFHSGNLYQLFSYLKNAAGKDPTFQAAEGILLYPQVQYSLNASFSIQGRCRPSLLANRHRNGHKLPDMAKRRLV